MGRSVKDKLDKLDEILFQNITDDIINGTLLTKCDNDTLHMLLVGIWEDMSKFQAGGVIVGEA